MPTEALTQINKYAYRYGEHRGLHTICFVHGLTGHPLTTWGKFASLLRSDVDLPEVDILMAGFKTRMLLRRVHDLVRLGTHLMTTLQLQVDKGRGVHLVGHSMGGLVSFQALLTEMVAGRAQDDPSNKVQFVSLAASPVNGKTVVAIVKNTYVVRHLLNKHLRALAGGKTAEDLVNLVKAHIYQPATNDATHRRIPIRMIMAARDGAVDPVDKASIRATFDTLRALELDYGHRSIKKPESTADDRYRAIVDDLKEMLVAPFQAVCKQCLAGDSTAPGEFLRTYEPVVRRYYDKFDGRQHKDDYAQFVRAVWTDGAAHGKPVHDTARRAAASMAAQKRFGP
jgi:pimeloyl-ACP methyl ester carboxylesterase